MLLTSDAIQDNHGLIAFVKCLRLAAPFHLGLKEAKCVADVAREFGGETAMTLLREHFAAVDAVEEWRTVGDNNDTPLRRLLCLGNGTFAWVENKALCLGDIGEALALPEVPSWLNDLREANDWSL